MLHELIIDREFLISYAETLQLPETSELVIETFIYGRVGFNLQGVCMTKKKKKRD